MICKYEYRDNILFMTLPETLSDTDFRLMSEEVEGVEQQYPFVPNFIVDLTHITTFNGNYNSVQGLAKQRERRKFLNTISEALVVSNDFQKGFARMYQTVNDNPQLTIRIFTEMAEAIEWIKSQAHS